MLWGVVPARVTGCSRDRRSSNPRELLDPLGLHPKEVPDNADALVLRKQQLLRSGLRYRALCLPEDAGRSALAIP